MANCLTSLILTFLICKVGLIIVLPHRAIVRIAMPRMWLVLNKCTLFLLKAFTFPLGTWKCRKVPRLDYVTAGSVIERDLST